MIIPSLIKESARGYEKLLTGDVLYTNNRTVFFNDTVTAVTAHELIKELMVLDSESHEPITLHIASPGGECDAGLAVFDYITTVSKSKIITVCSGLAASMGFVLFLAGEERIMLRHSRLMLHDPAFGGGSLEGVKPMEIKNDILERLLAMRKQMGEIISERSGLDIDEVYALTEKDTYLTADEALEKGFATRVIREKGEL